MSETPRTDAAARKVDEMCVGMGGFLEFVSHARELERELSTLSEALTLANEKGARVERELAALTKGVKITIPTYAMEQEFATHERRGYERGKADAKETLERVGALIEQGKQERDTRIAALEAYSAELHRQLEKIWYTPTGRAYSDDEANAVIDILCPTDDAMGDEDRAAYWFERHGKALQDGAL